MRHAGMHWPENAGGEHPSRETIAALPGIHNGCALICSPSARYHYDFLRQRCPLVVWRAIPRQGKLPAQLGWNAERVAAECMNLWFEQPHGGTEHFLPLNELQLEKENGGPFPGYGKMAQNLSGLRQGLRSVFRGQDVKLMFPAWVPSDDGDKIADWAWEAGQWDTICLHAYGSVEAIWDRYQSYRHHFPTHPIFVGEWNSNHEGHDERRTLELFADIADSDHLFMGAAYYIWETRNEGEHDLSICGNAYREDLFRDPPFNLPAPVPEPEPTPEPAPEPIPVPEPPHTDPWEHFTAEQITAATGCPIDAITEHWPRLVAQLALCGINTRAVQVAAIGTTAIETASTFRPIHEYGTPADWAGYEGGAEYAGRGFIQLTHLGNYREYGRYVDELWNAGGAIDLVARPDDALDPDVAAAVLATYFVRHTTIQGYSIPQAAEAGDWEWVRRLVQGGTAGLDRLIQIARALEGTVPEVEPVKLSEVLARGRSRIGDPYVWDGEQPGGFDCSGFLKFCYDGQLTSFTDSILGETDRVEKPAPGDIVLWEYKDPSQPGVRFPHCGLFLDDATTLDSRGGVGVGEHPQLPRTQARRFYRRMPGVIVDTLDVPVPQPEPAPPSAPPAPTEDIGHLRDVIGYVSVDIANALDKEAATIRAKIEDAQDDIEEARASLSALEAAINTLRSQKVA